MLNFFRKDLNLNKRWWHRLLVVVFFAGFAFCLWWALVNIYSESDNSSFTYYKIVEPLSGRLTSEVKSIDQLIRSWERFQQYRALDLPFNNLWNKYGHLPTQKHSYEDDDLKNIYCSTMLYKNVNEVIERTKITSLYISELDSSRSISLPTEEFSDYIKQKDIYCLWTDSFGETNKFLEPQKMFQDDYYFYKKTLSSRMINIAESLMLISILAVVLLFIFSLIAVFYYKVVLYVIYWNNSNKNNLQK